MKKVFIAFVLGFVGAVLFAPKSGKDLQRDFWAYIDKTEAELDKELKRSGIV